MVFVLYYGFKKEKPYPYYIISLLMSVYFNNAFDLVYFPVVMLGEEAWGNIMRYVDFSLDFVHMGGMRQIAGNILLTMPIGILLPFMIDVTKRFHRAFTIVISCTFEILQLLIICVSHCVSLFFDVKDILLNLLGGLLGLAVYEIMAVIIRKVIPSDVKNQFLNYTLVSSKRRV